MSNSNATYLMAEFEEDPQEEPEEEVEEDPEEDPEEGPEEDPEEAEAENDVPPPATPPVGSPITPPPLSDMDAPPSPNHVFNFPEAEFEEDPQEEPEEEVEEDPEEGPEEDPEEAEAENDVPPPATPPVGSPITPPPLSESSSDTEDDAPVIENEALEMPPIGSTYEVGGPSSVTPFPPFHMHGSEIARLDGNTELLLSNVQYLKRCEKKRKIYNETCSSEIREGKKRLDKMEQGLRDEMQFSSRVEHRVTDVENREQERDEEMVKVKKRLGTLEANYSLVLSDRDEWRRAFLNLQALVFERLGWVLGMHAQVLVMMGLFLLGSLNLPNHQDLLAVPISLFIIAY
nr:hypothetical protein [Tanacetum cinerariifolium]